MAGSLAVTIGLLITVGLASRTHALSRGGSPGSGRVADILIAGAVGLVALLIVALAVESHRPRSAARRPFGVGDVLIALVLVLVVAAASYGLGRVFHPVGSSERSRGVPCVAFEQAHGRPTSNCDVQAPARAKRARHAAHRRSPFPWFPIGAVIALLVGGSVLLAVERRRTGGRKTEDDDGRVGGIVDALDLSIGDLRRERDARRAIVAAYARMEGAFDAVGLPRRPAEAPSEYLLRALRDLDAGAAAARLTELFQLARFSDHAATPAMRDEAIDALLAVREELRTADAVVPTASAS